MKILHFDLDDIQNPLGGGQAVRTFEINRRLAKKGHDITVYTSPFKGSKNETKDGVKYRRIGFAHGPLRYISYFLSIPFIILTNKSDIVIEDNIPPFTFGLSGLYTRRPVISITQFMGAKMESKKHHFPFWIIETFGAKIYRRFIVLTENMKTKIRALNKRASIIVIPNGIDSIPPTSHTKGDYLLYLGRIDFHEKGLDMMIEIMELLHKKIPSLRLIVAGKGNDEEKLKQVLKEKNPSNIEYIGKIIGTEKEQMIKNCFALTHPSRYDNFPFTFLEAASYGKPILCFSIENLKELMEEKIGLSTKPFDIEKFADNIVTLWNDRNLYGSLSKNAHDWAKRHLWENIVEEQEKYYFDCLKKNI